MSRSEYLENITEHSVDDLRNEDGEIDARSVMNTNHGNGKGAGPRVIPREACRRYRVQAAGSRNLREVYEAAEYTKSTVLTHAKGECEHDHTEARDPVVRWGVAYDRSVTEGPRGRWLPNRGSGGES